MEKRRSKRKLVELDASLVSNKGKNYGFIENLCEHGLHIITPSVRVKKSYIPESVVELNINPLGNKANLHCEIRWVHLNKTPIHGLTYRMGLEILNQPPAYKEFVKGLE
jgi:hypothetical protein